MASLKEFLKENDYKVFNLQLIHTNHFKIKMKLNGIEGDFIVDTGASNTCVGLEGIQKFELKSEVSEIKASGAGAIDMETYKAANIAVKMGWWKTKIDLVILDLSHVNTALKNHLSEEIDGIIGADLLKKGSAVIDYSKNRLFLKKL